eukprot:6298933-Alexandrium_andersonii.AAC.1
MALRLRSRSRGATPLEPGQSARYPRGRTARGSPDAVANPESGIPGPVAAGELERGHAGGRAFGVAQPA